MDDQRLLVNHARGETGMWIVEIDGDNQRVLRPRNGHGAICHQVITERGIFCEANDWCDGQRIVWYGHYWLEDDTHREMLLPGVGYVHSGRDPAGNFHRCWRSTASRKAARSQRACCAG